MGKPKKQQAEKRAPDDREKAAILKAEASMIARPARAEVTVTRKEDGVTHMEATHSDANGAAAMINNVFGTTSADFSCRALAHIASTNNASQDGATTEATNSGLALMGAIAPRDELEAALAVQMVATHELAMLMLTRSRNAGYVEQVREYGNLATKLSRTFTGQMKELADWRRDGAQIVKHIHISGGQAMVAETIQIGGQETNASGRCHALSAPVWGQNPEGHPLPGTGMQRAEALPDARGEESGGTPREQEQLSPRPAVSRA